MINLQEIEKIERESFFPPYLFENLEKMYDNERYKFFCEERESILIAYIIVVDMVDVLEIIRIAVSSEYRGKGFGDKLMKKALEYAKEKGLDKILLEVRKSNEKAISLYKKYLFKEISERKGYYDDGEDALIMMRYIH